MSSFSGLRRLSLLALPGAGVVARSSERVKSTDRLEKSCACSRISQFVIRLDQIDLLDAGKIANPAPKLYFGKLGNDCCWSNNISALVELEH